MAITQDRMQALIKEARHAESTYLALREALLALAQNFREGVIPAREYLQQVDQTVLASPAALMLYATEYEDRHFAQHGRKNERMKTYLEARRRAAGTQARPQTAPAFTPSAPQGHSLSSLHYQPPAFAQSQPLPQIEEQELEDFTPYQPAAQAKPLSLTAITEALKTAPPPSGHVPLQATQLPRSTSFQVTKDPDIERDLSEKEPDILPPLKEIF